VTLRTILCTLVISACAVVPVRADDAVPGHAVLVRPDGDALVVWDASPVVATFVRAKSGDADANQTLEHDAIRVLARLVPLLDPTTKTVTVRILYAKSGAVSPVYNTAAFTGLERYALLKASGTDVVSNRDRWESAENAPPPAWFTFSVTGKLPPR
jgi:hypothetical protein